MAVSTKTKKACATGLAGIALAAGANIAGVATASAAPATSVAIHTFPSTAAPTITTVKNPTCDNVISREGHRANGHNWVGYVLSTALAAGLSMKATPLGASKYFV